MPAYVIRHAGYPPNRVLEARDAMEGKTKPARKPADPALAVTKATKPANATAKKTVAKKKVKRK